jgi:hypothetical protein
MLVDLLIDLAIGFMASAFTLVCYIAFVEVLWR